MNKSVAVVVGTILVLGLVVVAFLAVPALNKRATGMAVLLYDEDGNKVYEVGAPGPLFEFFFVNEDGAIVVSALAHIEYVVMMSGDIGEVTVSGELVIESYPADVPGLPPIKTTTRTLGAQSSLTGSYEETVQLADLVYSVSTSVSYKIVFTATLTAESSSGETSDPWTDSCTLFVEWVPDGLSITGSIYNE